MEVEGISLQVWRREEIVKKDILAIITFLATGFLFYLVQIDGPSAEAFSPSGECEAVERVVVEKGQGKAPTELLSKDPEKRDS